MCRYFCDFFVISPRFHPDLWFHRGFSPRFFLSKTRIRDIKLTYWLRLIPDSCYIFQSNIIMNNCWLWIFYIIDFQIPLLIFESIRNYVKMLIYEEMVKFCNASLLAIVLVLTLTLNNFPIGRSDWVDDVIEVSLSFCTKIESRKINIWKHLHYVFVLLLSQKIRIQNFKKLEIILLALLILNNYFFNR